MKFTRREFLRLAAVTLPAIANGWASMAAEEAGTALVKSTKPQMITRAIPATGELLPVIGLGTWQAFDVASVPASLKPLGEVLRRFFAGGGRLIDSSPMYGQAEGVVGELLDAPHTRASAFIATKVWTSGREAGIAQMRRSFELFRTRVIDLMQIHNLLDWQTHLPTLRKMKDAGQIRYIGVTHYTDSALPALAEIIGREPLDFVQLAYSIDDREAERRVLSLAADHKVAVIANRPFGGGGMFTRVRGKSLPGWASDFGCASWADFFLKYIVSNPAVTCAIPATANPVHLSDNLEAGYGRLPDERERRRMAQLWDSM